jgi:hypothetical protein
MSPYDIGLADLPHREKQIAFFEKLLEAVEATRGVHFTQTSNCSNLKVRGADHLDDDERQYRIRLIRRTLVILKEGLGVLVATQTGPEHFEFWVDCPVDGGLPAHRWTSYGELYTPEPRYLPAAEFGLARL